jgi:hypothetical protein
MGQISGFQIYQPMSESDLTYDPQPHLFFWRRYNTDWHHPPTDVLGCELKEGNYYWVHRKWNNYPIVKTRFFKVTPKGYMFRKMNLERLFKRPLYPDKYILEKEKRLVFFFNHSITVYTEEPADLK